MSKDKMVMVGDSASVPTMQKVTTTAGLKKSANIPSMGQAPGSATTSQGGSASSGGSQKK